jgi:hypothetical protein
MCARRTRLVRDALALLGVTFLICAPFGSGCTGPGLEPPGDNAADRGMTPARPEDKDGGGLPSSGSAGASSGASGAGGGNEAGSASDGGVTALDGASGDPDGGVDADEDAGPLR